MSDQDQAKPALRFNITMEGQTIVPDKYNRNLQYTRKLHSKQYFPMKIK